MVFSYFPFFYFEYSDTLGIYSHYFFHPWRSLETCFLKENFPTLLHVFQSKSQIWINTSFLILTFIIRSRRQGVCHIFAGKEIWHIISKSGFFNENSLQQDMQFPYSLQKVPSRGEFISPNPNLLFGICNWRDSYHLILSVL